MSSSTPGPWVKDKDGQLRGSNGASVTVWAAGIATTHRTDEAEANAHLIAAAPDLLEALLEIIEALECGYTPQPDGQIFKDARAAIAKAEGRS